jgi:hypothetical protein
MNEYVRKFRGWVNTETGQVVDNRLLVDELDYLWDAFYYQTTIKCDVEPVDMALTFMRGRLVSVTKDRVVYLPLLSARVNKAFEDFARAIEEVRNEALNLVVVALGVPSEYFQDSTP